MTKQKFRPVLTAEQISHILSTISPSEDIGLSIHKQLLPFQAKISVGAIAPAYSVSPESEQKRLDLELRNKYENGLMSPEEEAQYESSILGV